MRTTVNIDDDLLAKARKLTGIRENAVLLREGLKALVEQESARRLARLGGSELGLSPISLRRSSAGRSWLLLQSGSTTCAKEPLACLTC